eukprot:gene11555-12746_t
MTNRQLMLNQLTIEESILVDDIADFLEENESTSYQESIEDIEDCIKRAEGFRTQYRRKHKELKMHLNELYEGTYQKAYNLTIGNLKEFIMKKKNSKRSLHVSEDLGDHEAIELRKRKMKFLLSEAERTIASLQKSFTLPLIQDDIDIKKRKDELLDQQKQLQMISVSMKDIIETELANGRGEESFDELNKRYEILVELKNSYVDKLEREFQNRELAKGKSVESKRPFNRQHAHYASEEKEEQRFNNEVFNSNSCFICGESDHVRTNGPGGIKLIQYFVCKKFVDMSPAERFELLKLKGLCFQCLFPGAEMRPGKHKEGHCQRDFACKHLSHDKYPRRKHVLVCEEHKELPENKSTLENYKTRCILRRFQAELPSYSKDISLVHHVEAPSKPTQANTTFDISNKAIYMLQTIQVGDREYSIFYDTGCGDFISKYSAVQHLGSRATEECSGPTSLGGVGGITTNTPHGIYRVKL